MSVFLTIFKTVGGWLMGGTLDRLLDTIEKKFDDEVEKERIKAEVTKTYVNAQANLLVGRTWWFQLLFVVPFGLWWSSVILDSIMIYFDWWGHTTAALPEPLNTWAGWIISALFLVNQGTDLIGRLKK